MSAYNTPLQPFVIVVGPTLEAIQASYINLDRILYKVESHLKTVDVCYKIFHPLLAKYPPECEQVWLLIQQNLCNYESKYDKKIKGVLRLHNKFSKMVQNIALRVLIKSF